MGEPNKSPADLREPGVESTPAGYDGDMAFDAIIPSDLLAPRIARKTVTEFLTRHGLARLCDDAALLTSELVTNAVSHARNPKGEIQVRGYISERVVRLEVVDDDVQSAPLPRQANAQDEHGRGMELVAKLADNWGWARTCNRKTVWLELAV